MRHRKTQPACQVAGARKKSRVVNRLPFRREALSLFANPFHSLQGLSSSLQHGLTFFSFPGGNVGAKIDTVDEIDVTRPAHLKHGPVSFCATSEGVAGGIIKGVSLDFRYFSKQGDFIVFNPKAPPQEIGSDLFNWPSVKFRRERWSRRGAFGRFH